MQIKPLDINNVRKLKQGDDKRTSLIIPFFQRPFKWEEGNVNSLFTDYSRNSSDGNYFIGTAIACKLTSNAEPKVSKYEIVDGQQRLTTLFLLNYLGFLIRRAYIEKLIISRSSKVAQEYKELIERYDDFIGNGLSTGNNSSKMQNNKTNTENALDAGDSIDTVLKKYRDSVGLPDKEESELNFKEEYKKSLKKFLDSESLVISYLRAPLNDKLKEALFTMRFSLDEKKLYPEKNDYPQDEITKKYVETLQIIFTNVAAKIENPSSINGSEYAGKCLDVIDHMIDNIQLFLLTSDNNNDAYTLFEVLNDRGCDIDDLELTKNIILKQYYCKNESDPDRDTKVGRLDDLWEDIFSPSETTTFRNLIAYLGTVYLCGDCINTPSNKEKPYKDLIQKRYDNSYTSSYCYTEAWNDIAFFGMAKCIISQADLSAYKLSEHAISAEKNTGMSIIYKTLNLLHAVKCGGVLPIIVNSLINDYKKIKRINDYTVEQIDLEDFEKYIKNAMKPSGRGLEPNMRIMELADKVWKCALLSKDYNNPRDIAIKIIKNCWRDNYDENAVDNVIKLNDYENQFKEWTKSWRYTNNDLLKTRITILFLRLFNNYQKEDTGAGTFLKLYPLGYFKEDTQVELDHLEPEVLDEANEEDYFCYGDENKEERDDVIHSIGNMMIIDKSTNAAMKNIPMKKRLNEFYSTDPTLAGKFLYKDIESIFDSNHTINSAGNEVPTVNFFTERSELLINCMAKLLLSEYEQNKIQL